MLEVLLGGWRYSWEVGGILGRFRELLGNWAYAGKVVLWDVEGTMGNLGTLGRFCAILGRLWVVCEGCGYSGEVKGTLARMEVLWGG